MVGCVQHRESFNGSNLELFVEPIKEGSSLCVPTANALERDPQIGQHWIGLKMQSRIRVLCTDGRLFEGLFHCIDSDGNVILKDGEWVNAGLYGTERKPVGLSLYTKKWIDKIYFAASPSMSV